MTLDQAFEHHILTPQALLDELSLEGLDIYVLCALLGFVGELHARPQEKVFRAFFTAASSPRHFLVTWGDAIVGEPYDDVSRAHRLLRLSSAATLATYLCWLSVLGALRLGFGL